MYNHGMVFSNLLSRLSHSEGLKSAGIIAFGNLFGTTVSALAMIILSRYFGPAQFGVFSSVFALLVLSAKLADLGLNLAAQRYIAKQINQHKAKALSMVSLLFYLKLALLFFLTFLGLFSTHLIANFLHLPSSHLVYLIFLLVFGVVIYEYALVIAQTFHRFSLAATIIIIQAVGKLGLVFFFLLTHQLTIEKALILYALMPLIAALYGLFKLKLNPFTLPTHLQANLTYLKQTVLWTGIAILAATLADNLDTLLIKNMLTSYQTGLWSAAVRIATFTNLIGISFGMVLNVRVARYSTKQHLDRYLKKARLASLLMFLTILALTPLAKLGIWLTSGPAYFPATLPLILLLIATALSAATSPFVALFFLFEKPQFYAYSGILLSLVLILGDLTFIPRLGLIGAGLVKIIVRLTVFIFTLWYAKKAYEEHFA